ncbi:MAG TPA: arginine--tRNA ligase [Acidimicrobiales bacterium]|nr:arginine--tRNA ligase [Acidimicrobiales bacterium]
MAGLLASVDAVFRPVFEELQPRAASGLRPSQHADLQVDGALALARSLGRVPRELAEVVLAKARERGLDSMCEAAVVAPQGFINLTLSDDFLVRALGELASDPASLGVTNASPPLLVVVDYAAPNAAKQMHVGHLRSTIIGDSLVRLLEMVGHKVVRENHLGDWGAPFGMLIEHLLDLGEEQAIHERALGDLERFYQAARSAYDNDPGFAERARARVVLLQSGDQETLRLWDVLVHQSVSYFDEAFRRLGTRLTRDDVVGESYYNPLLPSVVRDLAEKGLLVESEGARCVFPPGYSNRAGDPLPLIIQNSVGGYTYAATDLAAIRDRVDRLGADLILYVVGLPQADHLAMVFTTARLAGWLPEGVDAVHVGFGNVLGPDGKMFRTRQGGTVKLDELLDEAVDRAKAVIEERDQEMGKSRRDELSSDELEAVAGAVGVGAVKYADLATDRTRDYRFDWGRMLSFDGNTGPYLQYAHARICSIFGRAAEEEEALPGGLGPDGLGPDGLGPGGLGPDGLGPGGLGLDGLGLGRLAPDGLGAVRSLSAPEERELAKRLLGFADAVSASLATYHPHKLCGYLFELASTFTAFYEHCPVLRAPNAETRASRLALCALTAAVLEKGLGLLGIETPPRM